MIDCVPSHFSVSDCNLANLNMPRTIHSSSSPHQGRLLRHLVTEPFRFDKTTYGSSSCARHAEANSTISNAMSLDPFIAKGPKERRTIRGTTPKTTLRHQENVN
jgi:hypothetical protein